MLLASVTAMGGGATDRLLAVVVARLQGKGLRVAGVLRAPREGAETGHCDSDLQLLPDGPVVRITQNLGSGSKSCRMDAGALEDAVGIAMARFSVEGADLVVLNKFGLSEAQGRGFRALLADALLLGIPVLLSVSEKHREAFERFAEGISTDLPPDEDAVVAWCLAAASSTATVPEKA